MTIQEALRIGVIADRLARVSGGRFHFDRQKLSGVGMTDDDIDELEARFRGGVETLGLNNFGRKEGLRHEMTADEAMNGSGIDSSAVRACLHSAGFTIVKIGSSECPFKDERFDIPADEPCPVCGMTGGINDPDYCVG